MTQAFAQRESAAGERTGGEAYYIRVSRLSTGQVVGKGSRRVGGATTWYITTLYCLQFSIIKKNNAQIPSSKPERIRGDATDETRINCPCLW